MQRTPKQYQAKMNGSMEQGRREAHEALHSSSDLLSSTASWESFYWRITSMGRIVVSLPCAASAERGIIAEMHTQEAVAHMGRLAPRNPR